MFPTILSIHHDITEFIIKPEPIDFKKKGYRLIRTVLRRKMPEITNLTTYQNTQAIQHEVIFIAKQILNLKKEILEIHSKSIFIFSITDKEPEDEFWCDLILKAVEGLNYSYKLKTENTYLKNTPLSLPETMKEDCLKQRKIDRNSVNN